MCALLPNGDSFFSHIIVATGVTKDGKWIAEQHYQIADKLTNGQPERLIGVVQDNTSANRKAMRLMAEKQPK